MSSASNYSEGNIPNGRPKTDAPRGIVEITSLSTIKKDFNEKYTLYEQVGVREYWIVVPNDKVVYVFSLEQDVYEQVGIYEKSGAIASVLFPDLIVEHDDVFRC